MPAVEIVNDPFELMINGDGAPEIVASFNGSCVTASITVPDKVWLYTDAVVTKKNIYTMKCSFISWYY